MTRAPRILALAVGVGLVTTVAACGGGGSDNATDDSPTNSSAAKTSDTAGSEKSDGGAGAVVAAGNTVLDKVGNGTVISIDSEKNDTAWEVQVATSNGGEKEAYVSKDGKEITSGPSTKDTDADDKSENKEEVDAAELDFEAAAQKILDARSGKITELNLDDYQNRIVWEADVHHDGTKYEVKIDASSGKVVKNERD